MKTENQILMERKTAGDELDKLAAAMAAREGCSYTEAFRQISVLNPELVKKYNGVVDIERAATVNHPTLSSGSQSRSTAMSRVPGKKWSNYVKDFL